MSALPRIADFQAKLQARGNKTSTAESKPLETMATPMLRSDGESNKAIQNQISAAIAKGNGARKDDARNAVSEIIADMNEAHFVATEGGKVRIWVESWDHELDRKVLTPMHVSDFRTLHMNSVVVVADRDGNSRTVPVAEFWLKSPQRRQYPNGMALLPGMEAPKGVYNLWADFGIQAKPGDVEMPMRFIENVLCNGNKADANYLIQWLAWGVQNPAKQAEVAVVLQGKKGTGKGTLGRWMLAIYGMHGLHVLHRKHLIGNFNAHLRMLCFIFADEALFAGDHEGQEVLKGVITEDQLTIERKGVDAFSIRNRLKVLMATNNAWVVKATEDERRYFVLEVGDSKRGDLAYFDQLERHMRKGGLAAFLHHLMNLDLSDFNIRAVPNTQALEKQKLLSLPPFKSWMYERLWEGSVSTMESAWCREQKRDVFVAEFADFVRQKGFRYAATSAASIGDELRDLFPTLGEKRETTGRRQRLWVLPPLEQARREFADYVGLEYIEWPGAAA